MELTQKGEVVSRLQAKAGQIGKILNNLEKYNHLIQDSNREKKSFEKRPISFNKSFASMPKVELKEIKVTAKDETSSNATKEIESETKVTQQAETLPRSESLDQNFEIVDAEDSESS